MIFETERLSLRPLTPADWADLCEILQDAETMYAYEHAFSDAEVDRWLENQLRRYAEDGFGLWAVVRKADGAFVGQIGLTIQDVHGERVPEVGYLLKRKCWHMGYATEAAIGCRDYAFDVLGLDAVYSIIRENNASSRAVAERNGMTVIDRMVKHYYDMEMPHLVYCVKRQELRGE